MRSKFKDARITRSSAETSGLAEEGGAIAFIFAIAASVARAPQEWRIRFRV